MKAPYSTPEETEVEPDSTTKPSTKTREKRNRAFYIKLVVVVAMFIILTLSLFKGLLLNPEAKIMTPGPLYAPTESNSQPA